MIVRSLITFLSMATLIGCNGFDAAEPPPFAQEEVTTGHGREVQNDQGQPIQVAYTSAGKPEIFKELKLEINSKIHKGLSTAFVDAEIERLDSHMQPTSKSPKNLKVIAKLVINGKPYQLTFLNSLRRWKNGLTSNFQPASGRASYQLQSECRDDACKIAILRLSYEEAATSGRHLAAALVIQQNPKVRIQASKIASTMSNESWEELMSAYKSQQLVAKQQSFSVISGVSHSTGSLIRKDNGRVLVRYKTDRLSTETTVHKPENFEVTNDKDGIQGSTIGNNSRNGSLVIQMSKPPEAQAETPLPIGRIYLQGDNETQSRPIDNIPAVQSSAPNSPDVPVASAQPAPSQAAKHEPIIPIPNGPEFPSITSTYEKLESYRQDPNVQWAIRVWQGQEKDQVCGKTTSHFSRGRAENYFRKVQPLVPFFLAISHEVDVTPEVAYLSVIESQYATQDGDHYLDGEVNGQGSSAAGAFQILDGIARGISRNHKVSTDAMGIELPVFKVKNRTLDPKDFRYFPTTSFLAASLLMKENFAVYKADPALAILAYNQGMGKTAYIQKCAQESNSKSYGDAESARRNFDECMEQYSEKAMKAAFKARHMYFDTTLADVREYGMGASCAELHYVYGWLALKFIGSHPKHYGFKAPSEMDTSGLSPLLYFPNKTFPLSPIDPRSIPNPVPKTIAI